MTFDLALWKWLKPRPKKISPADVYAELIEDQEHPAVIAFDIEGFESSLAKEFGAASLEMLDLFECSIIYRGLIVHIPWSNVDEVMPRIKKVAATQGLHCHDPQDSRGLPFLAPSKRELLTDFESTRAKAEGGNPEAQARLGFFYEFGEGVTKNLESALSWYSKAADQGNRAASFNLAGCHLNGVGVKQDSAKAVEIYMGLANLGDEDAMFALAKIYEQGNGVPKNLPRAIEYYRKAAAKGLSEAKKAVSRISPGQHSI
jgi:hypothetical protein